MSRFSRSFALSKASWRVLRSEPGLFAFPLVGSLVNLVVGAAFVGLIALVGLAQSTSSTTSGANGYTFAIAGWVLLVLMYVVLAYITTLFSAALVIGALQGMRGERPTVGGCLRSAFGLTRYLLPWALFQATVAGIIRSLSERGGIFGALLGGLVGAAWSVVTFLALPIIVTERVGPIKALKRSGTLLKQTWGENLIGQAGLGVVGALVALPGIALLVVGVLVAGSNPILGFSLVAVSFGVFIVVALVMSALSGVYRAALYEYATTWQTPAAYTDLHLADAFRAR